MRAAEWMVDALAAYGVAGAFFAAAFVTVGIRRVDPVAKHARFTTPASQRKRNRRYGAGSLMVRIWSAGISRRTWCIRLGHLMSISRMILDAPSPK